MSYILYPINTNAIPSTIIAHTGVATNSQGMVIILNTLSTANTIEVHVDNILIIMYKPIKEVAFIPILLSGRYVLQGTTLNGEILIPGALIV